MSNEPDFSDPNLNDCCFLPTSTPNDNDHDEYTDPQQIIILQENETSISVPDDDQTLQNHYLKEDNNRRKEVKMRERHRRVKQLLAEKVTAGELGEEGSASSSTKKLQHNAKERMRRMRLNASYLALRALLPESRRSKKRWTAPAIVDKVLKHIPELENEIENLKQIKEDKAKEKRVQHQRQRQQLLHLNHELPQNLTVSVNQVRADEAILQICKEQRHRDDDDDDDNNGTFSKFLENMEAQRVCLKTASTLSICHNRICYQLHIQWNESIHGADYIRKLKDEVICWLR